MARGGDNLFRYDSNGNMTSRTITGATYTQQYDREGRLITVTQGADTTVFTYDGDGKRVTQAVNGVTTVFVNDWYEVQRGAPDQATTYYLFGGKRVAINDGGTLRFLLGDHLGSTSVAADTSGAKLGEVRYYAWGAERYTAGSTPTTYRYTGQRNESELGLMFYGARWYDPALGRWAQADSIVPQPGNPQSLNRYTYVNNNPLKYVDPSGHCAEIESNDPACWALYGQVAGAFGSAVPTDLWMWSIDQLSHLEGWLRRGIRFTGLQQWAASNVDWVVQGLDLVQSALGSELTNAIYGLGGTGVFPMINITGQTPVGDENVPARGDRNGISWNFGAAGDALSFIFNVIHETGHVVDTQLGLLKFGGGFWSTAGTGWLGPSGWANHKIDPSSSGPDQWVLSDMQVATLYARSNPIEDFADTFQWYVRGRLNRTDGMGTPSQSRQNALTVAIGSLQ